MNKKPIGIFDSGLGGLTVLKEIHKLMPGENLVYFGDSKRAPYGTKSKDTIVNFAFQDMRFMLEKGVKAVVIACNTVSSNALSEITGEFDIPVIEVISPGAAAGAAASTSNKIGVIGTTATIESGAYETELKKINGNCSVLHKSCPLFVPLVEEGKDFWHGRITELTAHRYLDWFKDTGIDALILGCTHYPLLKEVIQKAVGPSVRLIDSAESVANKLKTESTIAHNDASDGGRIELFTSGDINKFMPLCREILGNNSIFAKQVDIEKY